MHPVSFMGVLFQVMFNMRKSVGELLSIFLGDKFSKYCGLEVSDIDSMINAIGCQHLCVFSSINFNLRCTVVRI